MKLVGEESLVARGPLLKQGWRDCIKRSRPVPIEATLEFLTALQAIDNYSAGQTKAARYTYIKGVALYLPGVKLDNPSFDTIDNVKAKMDATTNVIAPHNDHNPGFLQESRDPGEHTSLSRVAFSASAKIPAEDWDPIIYHRYQDDRPRNVGTHSQLDFSKLPKYQHPAESLHFAIYRLGGVITSGQLRPPLLVSFRRFHPFTEDTFVRDLNHSDDLARLASLVFHEWPNQSITQAHTPSSPPATDSTTTSASQSIETPPPTIESKVKVVITPQTIETPAQTFRATVGHCTTKMESQFECDPINFTSDTFSPLLDYDMYMSQLTDLDWLNTSLSYADSFLDIESQYQFTALHNDTSSGDSQAAVTRASKTGRGHSTNKTINISSSNMRSSARPRTQTSMLFLNEQTGALSSSLTGRPQHASSCTPSPSPCVGLTPTDPLPNLTSSSSSSSSSSSPPHQHPYSCEHCQTVFRFSRDYWQHKSQAHNDFRYRCQLGCGKGFARHDNLVQHHRESKRHRRSPSPAGNDPDEASRWKRARHSSPDSSSLSSALPVDTDEQRPTSSRTSYGGSSNGTPWGVDSEPTMQPEYLRLKKEFELLTARYELVKREVHTLREEKEEWQAREYIRRQSENSR
ncbi:hypothetical protein DRE_00216 [Drechslerella stenobrocha 248]|uniref:C2H2-type domain-containing protein n=1 Tax=Drechslerella stenobrocha 248 TaxID=1043628 RepID=W7HXH8_9PEZI|nr:hypothetical protein DRE_00216 [Drechslerella stenobrocha 248]